MSEDSNKTALIFSKVPGKQTVPRSELWALLTLLQRMKAGKAYKVYIDASYVVNGSAQLRSCSQEGCPSGLLETTNADLWYHFHQTVPDTMHLDKVKAHLGLDAVRNGLITSNSFCGNFIADVLAGAAAELSALPEIERRQADAHLALAYGVCLRLAVLDATAQKLRRTGKVAWTVTNGPSPTSLTSTRRPNC